MILYKIVKIIIFIFEVFILLICFVFTAFFTRKKVLNMKYFESCRSRQKGNNMKWIEESGEITEKQLADLGERVIERTGNFLLGDVADNVEKILNKYGDYHEAYLKDTLFRQSVDSIKYNGLNFEVVFDLIYRLSMSNREFIKKLNYYVKKYGNE